MRPIPGGRAIAVVGLCAGATLGVAGCGANDRQQVRDKVNQFIKATQGKDYKTLCDQVLAPALLARMKAGGIECEQAMQVSLQNVKNPGLAIGRVDVHGSKASVITLTTATGQQASIDAIELIKTGHGWRVASLGTPSLSRNSG